MPAIVTARTRRFKLMPFGEPGTSKTTWSCGAQDHGDMRPVLVIDSDDGLLSVAARGDIAAEECKTLVEYETILGRIAAGDPVFKEFNTIITDSGSDLLDKGLREEAARNFEKFKDQQETSTRGRRVATRNSPDDIHMKDYGVVTARMKRLFDIARNLPKHVIITSLAATHFPVIGKDEYGQDKLGPEPDSVHPSFTAKLGVNIRGLMDFVWYFYRETKEAADGSKSTAFRYLTQEYGPYKCKTRGAKFPTALGLASGLSLPEVYDLLLQTEGA